MLEHVPLPAEDELGAVAIDKVPDDKSVPFTSVKIRYVLVPVVVARQLKVAPAALALVRVQLVSSISRLSVVGRLLPEAVNAVLVFTYAYVGEKLVIVGVATVRRP